MRLENGELGICACKEGGGDADRKLRGDGEVNLHPIAPFAAHWDHWIKVKIYNFISHEPGSVRSGFCSQ